jgi:hypothetical protein
MRRLLGVVAATALLLGFGAGSASAAVEFGSSCTADRATGAVEAGSDLTAIGLAENGAQTAAPASGVITQWKVDVTSEATFGVPQTLKVLRPTANPAQFRVSGESASENATGGANAFDARIPVEAGDHLGLHGNSVYGALYCEAEAGPGDSMGFAEGDPPDGSTATVVESNEYLLPARATIEPDADNDGYGDETQDLCPSNAAVHTACPPPPAAPPPVLIDAFPVVQKASVLVLVDTSVAAPVTVTGAVKTKKGFLSLAAAPIAVSPGQFGKAILRFPGKLRRELRKLPKHRALRMTISASAPNAAGPASTKSVTAVLRGQGANARHRARHGKRRRGKR